MNTRARAIVKKKRVGIYTYHPGIYNNLIHIRSGMTLTSFYNTYDGYFFDAYTFYLRLLLLFLGLLFEEKIFNLFQQRRGDVVVWRN
jgi:hypothetical protein